MPALANCPMGSPSLLNGDFNDNVARLKDFSWSVIFSMSEENSSSDGTKKNTTTTAGNTEFPDFRVHNVLVAALTLLFSLAYMSAVLFITYKLTKNMKVTRIFVISTLFMVFAATELWCFSMMWIPLDDDILVSIFVLLSIHSHLITIVFLYKLRNLRPLDVPKFHCGPLGLIFLAFLAVSVLLFLFFPATSMNPMECPSISNRFYHEIIFYVVLLLQLGAFICLVIVPRVLDCEEFGIYRNCVLIGRLVKKEGFGWIEHYEEGNGPHSLYDCSSKSRVRPIENYVLKI